MQNHRKHDSARASTARMPAHGLNPGGAPPASSYTSPPEDDDDADFCVLCIGECTCHRQPGPSTTPALPPAAVHHDPPPKLKIKLSASLLSKVRASNKGKMKVGKKMLVPLAKKRGRPPNAALAAQAAAARASTAPSALAKPNKGKGVVGRQVKKKKKKRAAVPWGGSSTEESDAMVFDDDDDDGALLPPPTHYPTFMPAHAVSSSADDSSALSDASSSSSDATIDGIDPDSDMEAEEEDYIIAEEHRQRARVRRELLGEDKGQDARGRWELKPRKRSVGLDGADMDVDSGAETDDDDDDDEDEDEDDDEDDEAEDAAGAPDDATADDDDPLRPLAPGAVGRGYVGVATGWTEDESSGLDASLFFAHLSHSASSASGDDSASMSADDDMDGADDMDGVDDPLSCSLEQLANEPQDIFGYPIMTGWDGEPVYAADFWGAAHPLEHPTPTLPSALLFETDFDLDLDLDPADAATPSEDGYERELEDADPPDGEDELTDGETTEEELVDAQGLPTPRAMALFRWPWPAPATNAAVDPRSTVSPARRAREPSSSFSSIIPTDLTAAYDSDEHDNDGLLEARRRRRQRGRSESYATPARALRAPRMGTFDSPVDSVGTAAAVINGRGPPPQSPFPRRRASRPAGARTRSHTVSSVQSVGSPLGRLLSDGGASFPLDSSSELSAGGELRLGGPIPLDDVLDSALLTDAASDAAPPAPLEDGAEEQGPRLSRWEFVPVNYFQQTRGLEAAWDGPLAGALKDSPFSRPMWPGAALPPEPRAEPVAQEQKRKHSRSRSRAQSTLGLAPPILPPDRERTPTPATPAPTQVASTSTTSLASSSTAAALPKHARREKRKEKRAPAAQFAQHQFFNERHGGGHARHQHHHFHAHHANARGRAGGGVQRGSGSGSGVGGLPLGL